MLEFAITTLLKLESCQVYLCLFLGSGLVNISAIFSSNVQWWIKAVLEAIESDTMEVPKFRWGQNFGLYGSLYFK